MTKTHWLNITEYIAIAASIGGTIGTIITQQVIFTATPLTIALALNTINRQRQFISIRQLPDIYDDLISVNEDYRFHKLEIQEKLEKSEQNQALLRSDLEQFDNFYHNEISKLYDKISVLENQQDEAKINELHQLYSSLTQRLNRIEDVINSKKEQLIDNQKQGSSTRNSPPSVPPQYKTQGIYESDKNSKNNTQNQVKSKPHNPETSTFDDSLKDLNKFFKDLDGELKGILGKK